MTQIETKARTKTFVDLSPPSLFKVIYLNDSVTAMEFVIDTLIDHFDYTFQQAEKITIDIHQQGSAVVAVLPYELAEQKGIEITLSAREKNYPLQIKLEPDSN